MHSRGMKVHVKPAPPPHTYLVSFPVTRLIGSKRNNYGKRVDIRLDEKYVLVAPHVEHAWVSIFRDNDIQTQHNELFFSPPDDYVLYCEALKAYHFDLICIIVKYDILHHEGQIC